MISRKKPQQQLASYFDELLTELDEQDVDLEQQKTVEPQKTTEQKSVERKIVEQKVLEQGALEPNVKVNTEANVKVNTEPKAKAKTEVKAEAKTVTKTASAAITVSKNVSVSGSVANPSSLPASKPNISSGPSIKQEPTISCNHTSSQLHNPLSSEPSSSSSSRSPSQPLPTVDLRQRDKEKLERLLKTLTPTVESQLIQTGVKTELETPLETVKKPVTSTVELTPKVAVENKVDNKVEKKVKSTADTPVVLESEKVVKAENVTVDIAVDDNAAVPIDMISASPHRWQPLKHEWQDNGRPEWAENPFDVLLVDVNGVQLALPLESLDAIYPLPLDDGLTPLFGQAKWFMGLQKTIAGNVSIINTAQFVMPERYDEEKPKAIKYSVAINGSGWGLAVDNIHQPVLVNPDDIRWRVNRAARPWMAGTVKNHMCALIDIPYLAHSLKTQNKNTKMRND